MKIIRQFELLGATLAALAITFSLPVRAQAQTETTLFSFTGTSTGENPDSGLVFDHAGNLYGTTPSGGATSRTCKMTTGCGMVYELSPDGSGGWTQTILYTFTGAPDGQQPAGTLTFDAAGNIYGVTNGGGNKSKPCWTTQGCGVVYRLSPNSSGGWTETVLYAFTGGADGASPYAGVSLDAAGNLYGTASYGGNTACTSVSGGLACGVVFELSPSSSGAWTQTLLHSFTGGADGYHPYTGVIFDSSGNLYGSAQGATTCGNCSVAFRLSPVSGGWHETVIHNFSGGRDGGGVGSLMFDGAGNLYGIAGGGNPSCGVGGGSGGCGVVFKLTPNPFGAWKETSFAMGDWDGAQLGVGLALDAAGNIYGAATSGGILSDCGTSGFGCGVVFKLTPNSNGNWTPTVLHRFTGGADGGNPFAGPTMDAEGNLYGTAAQYGAGTFGTVYEIKP